MMLVSTTCIARSITPFGNRSFDLRNCYGATLRRRGTRQFRHCAGCGELTFDQGDGFLVQGSMVTLRLGLQAFVEIIGEISDDDVPMHKRYQNDIFCLQLNRMNIIVISMLDRRINVASMIDWIDNPIYFDDQSVTRFQTSRRLYVASTL